jgi:excisionase family DNA binding protein
MNHGRKQSTVSVAEASALLAVHPARVRRLLEQGDISGWKVAGRWVVSSGDIDTWKQRRAGYTGRPLKPIRAWALLWDMSGELPAWVDAGDLWKLRRARAASDLPALSAGARLRGRRMTFRAHPSDLPRIASAPGLMRSGISAASAHGLDVIGSDAVEGYVDRNSMEHLVRRFHMQPSDRPNVVLRVVDDDSPIRGRKVAPFAAAILDLFESGEPRAIAAARRAWWKLSPRSA